MQFFYPFMTVDKPRDRVYRGVEPSEIERGLRRVVSRDPYLRFEFVEIYLRDEFLDNDPDQLYIIENAEIRRVRSEKIILFFFRGTFLFLFFFLFTCVKFITFIKLYYSFLKLSSIISYI